MNWVIFLRDAYDENGVLMNKNPQVDFDEKPDEYARVQVH